MFSEISQSFPPKPKFTEKDLPDLSGRVYLITGASAGVGAALTSLLYAKNATVHLAARSEAKAQGVIAKVRAEFPDSRGTLAFLPLQLEDLPSVAASARAFLAANERLDVLFANAGVMYPRGDPVTEQGYELQLGVNNLAHVLFAEMLAPLLARTAKTAKEEGRLAGGVRVVWVGSLYAELKSPKGGFEEDNMNYKKKARDTFFKYSVSKAGAYYQGVEFARRYGGEGVVSLSLNPGNLKTELLRDHKIAEKFVQVVLHPAVYGAYTELFAGLSPDVTPEKQGCYIHPWGRFGDIRKDLALGAKTVAEGGSGKSAKWYDWCLEQVKPFMDQAGSA